MLKTYHTIYGSAEKVGEALFTSKAYRNNLRKGNQRPGRRKPGKLKYSEEDGEDDAAKEEKPPAEPGPKQSKSTKKNKIKKNQPLQLLPADSAMELPQMPGQSNFGQSPFGYQFWGGQQYLYVDQQSQCQGNSEFYPFVAQQYQYANTWTLDNAWYAAP
jgi:hypothetical protein